MNEAKPSSVTTNASSDRVLLLYTGGTLGMIPDEVTGALKPHPTYLSERLESFLKDHPGRLPQVSLIQYEPLLDSSDMTPREWLKIASDIEKYYYEYNGFVIIHGTDTCAYTASGLSFILENLNKPVVLTGSQLPLVDPLSDAHANLMAALCVAAYEDIPEVCIIFNGMLFRGNRCSKKDSVHFDAFHSPNYPPLGQTGKGVEVNYANIRPAPKGRFRVQSQLNCNLGVLHLIPGFSEASIENICAPPIEGLILRTYGSGNVPKSAMLEILKRAIARGVIVVVISQCSVGSVNLLTYEAGRRLMDIGVISGEDMTIEAASTKLAYLLGKGLSTGEVTKLMSESLRGELTPPQVRESKRANRARM